MGSPDCEDLKTYICGKVAFKVPEIPPLWGVLGPWMTFKKAEMAKTLRNGLSMIEMNPLNHNWSHFVILLGLTLHQFQKKLLLSQNFFWHNLLHRKDMLQNNFWTNQGILAQCAEQAEEGEKSHK